MNPFIASVVMFGGNFAPRDWAFCDGQLLPISQNTALFSLLGTTFGGDGRTTFGLPDLRGRVPMHPGNGPGLSPVRLGQKGGSNNQVLSVLNLPPHNHVVNAHGGGKGTASTDNPAGAIPGDADSNIYATSSPTTQMSSNMVNNTGGGQQFSIMQPYTGVNYIIALFGVYPSRN